MRYVEITEANMGQKSLNIKPKKNYTYGAELEIEVDQVSVDIDQIIDDNINDFDTTEHLIEFIAGNVRRNTSDYTLESIIQSILDICVEEKKNAKQIAKELEDSDSKKIKQLFSPGGINLDRRLYVAKELVTEYDIQLLDDYQNEYHESLLNTIIDEIMGSSDFGINHTKDIFGYLDIKLEDVVPDQSLRDGAEVIIGVYNNQDEFFSDLRKCFDEIDFHDELVTTSRTGLHVNIGTFTEQEIASMDWLKVLTFFHGDKVLEDFNRLDNRFATSMSYIYNILIDKKVDGTYQDAISGTNRYILNTASKFQMLNLSKLKYHGYIELRAMGGENYHEYFDNVSNVVKKLIRCLEIGSDPNAYRKDYLKKLAKYVIEDGEKDDDRNKIDIRWKKLNDIFMDFGSYKTGPTGLWEVLSVLTADGAIWKDISNHLTIAHMNDMSKHKPGEFMLSRINDNYEDNKAALDPLILTKMLKKLKIIPKQ